jgi:hypothetical protein
MRSLFLLLLVAVLTGCADFFMQEIDSPDVDFERQLVLFTLLSPQDSLLFVDVRETAPVFGPRENANNIRRPIEGATVMIDDGTTTHELAYYNENGQQGHAIDTEGLGLEAGKTYTVTASWDGLTATGRATIPTDTFRLGDISLDLETIEDGGFQERILSVTVPNRPGEDDYYLLIHDRLSSGSFVQRNLVDYVRGKDGLGESLLFAPVSLIDGVINTVNICTTDKATYDYFFSRGTAFNNQENPFAEPTEIIGNVEIGIGLVGAMNCRRVVAW